MIISYWMITLRQESQLTPSCRDIFVPKYLEEKILGKSELTFWEKKFFFDFLFTWRNNFFSLTSDPTLGSWGPGVTWRQPLVLRQPRPREDVTQFLSLILWTKKSENFNWEDDEAFFFLLLLSAVVVAISHFANSVIRNCNSPKMSKSRLIFLSPEYLH